MKQHYGSDWAEDQAEGFITFITFIPFIMILVIQEAYRNIRFWYDVDHYFTPCIALAACFYWFYVKHFELQQPSDTHTGKRPGFIGKPQSRQGH